MVIISQAFLDWRRIQSNFSDHMYGSHHFLIVHKFYGYFEPISILYFFWSSNFHVVWQIQYKGYSYQKGRTPRVTTIQFDTSNMHSGNFSGTKCMVVAPRYMAGPKSAVWMILSSLPITKGTDP